MDNEVYIQKRKLFAGGLSWVTTEERLKAYFNNYGTVVEVEVKADKGTGKPRGFGFVIFESSSVAQRVLAQKSHTIDRREVEVKLALPPAKHRSHQHSNSEEPRRIFVGGLPPTVGSEDLRGHFQTFGEVEEANVQYDSNLSHRSRCFGFVTFVSEEGKQRCLSHGSHQTIHDKVVEVKHALPRSSNNPDVTGQRGRATPARNPNEQRGTRTAPMNQRPYAYHEQGTMGRQQGRDRAMLPGRSQVPTDVSGNIPNGLMTNNLGQHLPLAPHIYGPSVGPSSADFSLGVHHGLTPLQLTPSTTSTDYGIRPDFRPILQNDVHVGGRPFPDALFAHNRGPALFEHTPFERRDSSFPQEPRWALDPIGPNHNFSSLGAGVWQQTTSMPFDQNTPPTHLLGGPVAS